MPWRMRAAVLATNGLTVGCIYQLHFPTESTLVALPTAQTNELHTDLGIVEERIKQGVTTQRAKAIDKHGSRWDAFCVVHNMDPYLKALADPGPMLQVFGERYRDGRLALHKKTVRGQTVEDGLRAIGQAHARLGG
jgi:hypothetical protein